MTQTEIEPFANQVLIAPETPAEKVGGILIPESAREKPQRGTVVKIGKGVKEAGEIKEGVRVVFKKHAGVELIDNGTSFILISDINVWAKV